jgi:hypothetical protein
MSLLKLYLKTDSMQLTEKALTTKALTDKARPPLREKRRDTSTTPLSGEWAINGTKTKT